MPLLPAYHAALVLHMQRQIRLKEIYRAQNYGLINNLAFLLACDQTGFSHIITGNSVLIRQCTWPCSVNEKYIHNRTVCIIWFCSMNKSFIQQSIAFLILFSVFKLILSSLYNSYRLLHGRS